MKLKLDRFVLAIIITIIIAWLLPGWGAQDSRVPIDTISSIGVSLIFFFYGLKLSGDKLRKGLKNHKLHLLIQFTTFLVFPAVILPFRILVHTASQEILWLAFFFLAALPSTVSSSVVMVSIARGNIPAAIFNASISGIIGIAITPLWMGVFMQHTSGDFDLKSIYLKLTLGVLLPVVVGVLLQKYWGKYVVKYSSALATFDKSVILLIIYKSFAESFISHVFSDISIPVMALVAVGVIVLFFCVYLVTGFAAKRLKFDKEDQITAQFCGTKKSLVHGTVFSKVLFANSATVGIILLPLMVFHAFQIVIISFIASQLAERENTTLM